MADVLNYMPELEGEEMLYVKTLLDPMPDDQAMTFAAAYRGQRRDPTTVLLLALIGFIGIGGVHRFYLGQMGWGILYVLTFGLCGIGTIIDLFLYKKLAFQYNQQKAFAIATMMSNRR